MVAGIGSVVYAVVCYAVFLGTFLYAVGFVGNVLVPRSIDTGPQAPLPEALLIDVLLLAGFAVQHSVMARAGFKRWWTRFVPAPVERSTYVLTSSLLLIVLFIAWRPLPGEVWKVSNPVGMSALYALFAAGWMLALVSTLLIDHFDLFGLRQAYLYMTGAPYSSPPLRTPGFYRIVRHPIMLGFLVAFWATPTMTWGHLLFAGMTTAYILVVLPLEERDLVAFFGEEYRQYQRSVPMLLPIPKSKQVDADTAQPARAVYDALAADYDRRWRGYIDRSLTKAIGSLDLDGHEQILDVACGTGELGKRLLERYPDLHITGVDVSPQMLMRARAKQLKGDVTWIEGDAAHLAVSHGPFDLLICANSFHFFRSPDECLERFEQHLAPGGRLIIVDWCDDYLLCKLCSVWFRLTDPAFYSIYTTRACGTMLAKAGFEVLHWERFRPGWPWGMMLFVCRKAPTAALAEV